MDKSDELSEKKRKSLYYGYIIVALSFIALFASMGIRGSFGTYVTEWEQSFSVSRVSVTFVSFTSLCVYGISIIYAGRLADRIGARKVLAYSMLLMGIGLLGSFFATSIWHIAVLYGVVGSVGFGFASNVTVSVAIVKWFKEKKGLMISIVVLGMAAGPMIYNPLNLFLLEHISWKWVFVIYGGIYTVVLFPLFVIFYRNSPVVKNIQPTKEQAYWKQERKSNSAFSIFRHPITWLLCLSYIICGFTDIGLINTHLAPLAEDRGFSTSLIGNALFLYGGTNIAGTLVIGYLTDKIQLNKLLGLLFSIRVIALLLLIFSNHPALLLLFALLYGLTDIATIAPFTMLCSKIFGEKQMGSAFGIISFFHQLGAALGSLIPGILFSISSDYLSTLWVCLAILCLNVILFLKIKENRIAGAWIMREEKTVDH